MRYEGLLCPLCKTLSISLANYNLKSQKKFNPQLKLGKSSLCNLASFIGHHDFIFKIVGKKCDVTQPSEVQFDFLSSQFFINAFHGIVDLFSFLRSDFSRVRSIHDLALRAVLESLRKIFKDVRETFQGVFMNFYVPVAWVSLGEYYLYYFFNTNIWRSVR